MSSVFQILRSLKNLPPFPLVAQRAMVMLNRPEVSIQELVEVVKFDTAITANILRVCNSAHFGSSREIHSLHQALLLLGTQELLKIIVISGVARLFSVPTSAYFSERLGLWCHSVSCALMMDQLAREFSSIDQATGFTAGLLHDLGKVALNDFVQQEFLEIMEIVKQQGVSFQTAEKIVLGIDHAEIGGEIARMWEFPDRLRLAIAYHHLDKPEAYVDDLILLVYLADHLVLAFDQDQATEGFAYTGSPDVLRHFHLRPTDLKDILRQFVNVWEEAQIFFGLIGYSDAI